MVTRPLEINEYNEIIHLIQSGFKFNNYEFQPNARVALALQLQACIGLRIGDVLKLRVDNFRNGKLQTIEEKTGKLQYRDINLAVYDYVKDYAIENRLAPSDRLIDMTPRNVQQQLKIVCRYMGLTNISTHSFRKMFATQVYANNSNNLVLVKELLNHANIGTTQNYVRLSQQAINDASSEINFIVNFT